MVDSRSTEKWESDTSEYHEIEINLVDLLRKMWKWKWLIIVLTSIITASVIYFIKSKPNLYTVEAGYRIGEIAGFKIEKTDDLILFLYETEFGKKIGCRNSISISEKAKSVLGHKLSLLYISSTNGTPKKALECVSEAVNFIHKNHLKLFESGIEELKRHVYSAKEKVVLNPKYFLRTFNYPSKVVIEPKKPNRANSKKLFVKSLLAFCASFIMSVFLAFVFEYINEIRNKND
jgi:hypothetical protein